MHSGLFEDVMGADQKYYYCSTEITFCMFPSLFSSEKITKTEINFLISPVTFAKAT